MKKVVILSLMLVSLIQLTSCAKEEKEFVYTKVDKRFEEMRRQQLIRQSKTQFSLDHNGEAIEESISPIVNGLCNVISDDNFESPFEYEKYFSDISNYKNYMNSITDLRNLDDTCNASKIIYDMYPIMLVEYELVKNKNLIIAYTIGKDKKITSFYPFFKDGFNISYSNMPTSDGVTISTLSFSQVDKKAKTIFTKTPYFHTSSNAYYLYDGLKWISKGYNFVVQSNRGSHASGGEFKWLHEKNIDDSKDTINWIKAQSFSNGKITAYGVSYDGFNALAAAVGDPQGLESVVACSAPSNASTDSFTAGKTVEAWLLEYIAERENSISTNLFAEKISYLTLKNTPLEEYDDYLYNRNIADWQDILDAKKDGHLSKYWATRSLLKGLAKTKTPIFHVAGTNNDQDSRDTVMAFDYLKKNDLDPSNHRLYIHNDGHGCGDFINTLGKDFLENKFENLKHEYKKSIYTGEQVEVSNEAFSKSSLTLDLTNDEIEYSTLNDRYDVIEGKNISLYHTAKENLLVNGSMNIELESMWNMFNSSVVVSMAYTKNGQVNQIHWQLSGSSRSAYYLNGESQSPSVLKLTLPPVIFQVEKGENLIINLSTERFDFIDIFLNERDEYYSHDVNRGQYRVMNGDKNKLEVTLEKNIKILEKGEQEEALGENKNETQEVVEIEVEETKQFEQGSTQTDII
jgi:pimeloyl-ACP methyl ester carboxylesterase